MSISLTLLINQQLIMTISEAEIKAIEYRKIYLGKVRLHTNSKVEYKIVNIIPYLDIEKNSWQALCEGLRVNLELTNNSFTLEIELFLRTSSPVD